MPSDAATSPETAGQAERLATEANQAAILGDNVRARALLREAVRLDPTSSFLRYRLGRLLDDTGEQSEALAEYCRYLALDPAGPEVDEVQRRLAANPIFAARAVELQSIEALETGVSAFDRGDMDAAAQEFSRALLLRPDWEQAHFNRGLAYLELGRLPAAAADLEWYLELRPDAEDRGVVEARLQAMEPAVASLYRPGTALVTGMILPGMGHFYSGRPGTGALVLAAAAGSAAVALLYKRVEVACLTLPIDGECPPGQVANRTESRPLLIPGLAAAAAVTVGGAVHAYLGARGPAGLAASMLSADGQALGYLVGGIDPRVRVEPVASRGGLGWRWIAEFSF